MKKLAILLALVFGLTGAATAQTSPPSPIRYQQGQTPNDGELQIAVYEFVHAATNTNVTLYGVVHVADQPYYDQVQRDLATYDTVLYEGVRQGTNPNPETKGLNSVQKLMADVLGLSFQKDGIDYNQANFVHADIDIDTLQRNLDGQSINPLEQYVSPETLQNLAPMLEMASQFIRVMMDSNPELRAQLQAQMAQQMAQTDISQQLPPQMRQAIIIDRNQIVMDVLAQQLRDHPAKRNLVIFYGAGHNPDFTQRLEAEGYARTNTRWMTAWRVGNGAPETREGDKSAEPEKRIPAEVR